jgi:DnaJ-class molecular chaperone
MTEGQLRAQYLAQCRKWHPDRAPVGQEAAYNARFQHMGQARDFLAEPEFQCIDPA